MQQYGQRSTTKNTSGGSEPHANGSNRKKSILKKSESSSHGHTGGGAGLSGGGNSALQKSSSGSKHDPELENLLVSDQESANTTPAVARKPYIVDLPPTANHEQIKSLTGPKLRKSEQSLKPILVNSNLQSNQSQNSQNLSKNNGTASKEIQTSTISLLALAAAAQNQAAANALQNANGSSDNTKKFERGRELTDTATSPVFRCPNDMCRHNRPSTALTSTKRKICLCGRTMVSPGGPLLYSDRIAS